MTQITQERLTHALQHAYTRILDVVDDQNDFMRKDGALSINPAYDCKQDASEIICPTNKFFADLPAGTFDAALIKFDTHFLGEYHLSPESKQFPNPHCLFGTDGWELAVDIEPLMEKFPTYMLAKNEFDMWGSNPTNVSRDQIRFTPKERIAYDNLFKFISLKPGDEPKRRLSTCDTGYIRDAFLQNLVDEHAVVVLCGVASDVCDYKAMMGYLQRGATVIVAEDLTRGIGAPGMPAPETGAMREVIATVLDAHPEYADQLFTAQSADIIRALETRVTARPTPRAIPAVCAH